MGPPWPLESSDIGEDRAVKYLVTQQLKWVKIEFFKF